MHSGPVDIRQAFAGSIASLYEKGLKKIGRSLDLLAPEQLKMLDSSLNSKGLDIGSIGTLATFPQRSDEVAGFVRNLRSLKYQERAEQPRICEEIAKIIDEI